MESKSIFLSKTAIANVLATALLILTFAGFDFELTAEQQTSVVGGVYTVLNIIMRLVTKQPAHVFKKPDETTLNTTPWVGIIVLMLVVGLLHGCTTATVETDTARKRFAAIKTDYASVLAVAVQYESLPRCPALEPCSDPGVVRQLRKAQIDARTVLDGYEAALKVPGADLSSWIRRSVAAVSAIQTIATNRGLIK